MRPGGAGRAVPGVDVPQAPVDLRGRVGAPVGAGARHLAAGQGLGDAVGAARGVVRVGPPARLPRPEQVEAPELVGAPAVRAHAARGVRLGRRPVDDDAGRRCADVAAVRSRGGGSGRCLSRGLLLRHLLADPVLPLELHRAVAQARELGVERVEHALLLDHAGLGRLVRGLGGVGGRHGFGGEPGALRLGDVRLPAQRRGIRSRRLRPRRDPAVEVGELRRAGEAHEEVGGAAVVEEEPETHVGSARAGEHRADPPETSGGCLGLGRGRVRLRAQGGGSRLRGGACRLGRSGCRGGLDRGIAQASRLGLELVDERRDP